MRTAFSRGSRIQGRVFWADRFPFAIHVCASGKLDLIAGGAWRKQHGRGLRMGNDGCRGCRRIFGKDDLVTLGPRREQRFRGKGSECERGQHRTYDETFIFHTFSF